MSEHSPFGPFGLAGGDGVYQFASNSQRTHADTVDQIEHMCPQIHHYSVSPIKIITAACIEHCERAGAGCSVR